MLLSSFIATQSFFTTVRRAPVKQVHLMMRASKKTKKNDPFYIPNSPKLYEPRGPNQIKYVEYLNNPNIIYWRRSCWYWQNIICLRYCCKEMQGNR